MSVATKLASGLRLFCPLEKCKTVEFTAPEGGVSAGDLVRLNSGLIGVVYGDAEADAKAVLIYEALDVEGTLTSAANGTDYAVGSPVYLIELTGKLTKTASTNSLIGFSVATPASSATKCHISLHGDLATVEDVAEAATPAADVAEDLATYIALGEDFVLSLSFAAATLAGAIVGIAPYAMKIISGKFVSSVVAGQAGAMQIEKCAATEAAGSGTDMLATAVDLTTTALTAVSLSLSGTPATVTLAAGDVIRLVLASGAATSLAGANVTLLCRRVES